MELSDLRVFISVVDEGGISHAAKKLHRVPSNVSARIKKLEEQLESQLFIRDKKQLQLSPSGKRLNHKARELLKQAELTMADIKGSTATGPLLLGAIEMAAATRLVEPIMQFHRRYPDIELQLRNAPSGMLIEQVLNGELDIAMVSDPANDERLSFQNTFSEQLVLVSAPEHGDIREPSDIKKNCPILGFSEQCSYRRRLNNWFQHHEQRPKTLDIHSYHAMLSCAAAGMGIALVPQAVLDIFPYQHGIKAQALPRPWGLSQSKLIWRKGHLSHNARLLAQLLADISPEESNSDR